MCQQRTGAGSQNEEHRRRVDRAGSVYDAVYSLHFDHKLYPFKTGTIERQPYLYPYILLAHFTFFRPLFTICILAEVLSSFMTVSHLLHHPHLELVLHCVPSYECNPLLRFITIFIHSMCQLLNVCSILFIRPCCSYGRC